MTSNTLTVRTTYRPPTDTQGSYIRVSVVGGGTRTYAYDYSASDPHRAAIDAWVTEHLAGEHVERAAVLRELQRGFVWTVSLGRNILPVR